MLNSIIRILNSIQTLKFVCKISITCFNESAKHFIIEWKFIFFYGNLNAQLASQ